MSKHIHAISYILLKKIFYSIASVEIAFSPQKLGLNVYILHYEIFFHSLF